MDPWHRSAPVPSRRALLAGLGASAFLSRLFIGREGHAQGAAPPTNLVVVTWPEGLEKGWQPTVTGNALTMSAMLAPFEPLKKEVLFINGPMSGFNILSALTAHTSGPMSLWTGCNSKGDGGLKELSTLPSIDQLVANKFGKMTPFASLNFGVQANRDSFISVPYVHYAGSKQPVSAEDDPNVMFNQIFGSAMGQDAATLDRQRRRKKSVLDFVSGEISRVKGVISASDRPKLDQHLAGIAAIENNLANLGKSCGAATPTLMWDKKGALDDANFPAVIKLQTDLMVAALQCQLTRVATLQMSNTDSQTKIPGIATQRAVHDAQHSGTLEDRIAVGGFFVQQLAYVVSALKNVQMPDGTTLLDKTLVVMGSDMAIGTHSPNPAPFFVAGGGGVVGLGRYLDVSSSSPQHTKLLAAIAQAMGLTDVTTIGDFPDGNAKGILDGILA